jgi:hypothetical protein
MDDDFDQHYAAARKAWNEAEMTWMKDKDTGEMWLRKATDEERLWHVVRDVLAVHPHVTAPPLVDPLGVTQPGAVQRHG